MQAYKQLEERFGQIQALKQVSSLIDWDKSVMMPEKGGEQRGRQMEVLNVKIHEMQTDPAVGDWIAKTERGQLTEWQTANLRIIEWLYAHATAVPAHLVARKMNQQTRTEMIWRKARAENDFKMVRDELERLLDIVREFASAKSTKLNKGLYDALFDNYSPGMTSAEVDIIFDDIGTFIPKFLGDVLAHQKPALPLKGPFPIDTQKKMCLQLAQFLGMEPQWSRLDASAHPFSMGIGDDVRITTRFNENDFTNAMQAVAHEVGHGLYDRYTPREWHHQPVGASLHMGLAIHESQSLSLDQQLARSLEYWQFMAPHVQKAFGREGAPELSAENIHRHVTTVSRGFVRIEADEVTYPAHVIMRYRLEKRMVESKLEVKDLPDAWAAEFGKLIGVRPPSDKLGCLQDIHWYMGAFGYFPTYALGAFLAAQYADKIKKDIPDFSEQMRGGKFTVMTGWLTGNVQMKGCLYTPMELVERATGQKMSTAFFKKHLTDRYLG